MHIDEMAIRAIGDDDLTGAPTASGDTCPSCGAILAFEAGEQMSRHSPGIPPSVYCPDCGLEFEIDWERQGGSKRELTGVRPTRIYVASKTKHAAMWKSVLASHQIEIISTWIHEAGPGESIDRADLALRCIAEARDADCLILYCEPGEYLKGAFIEIGAALAANKPVYVVGEALPETSTFRCHPCWHQYQSVDAVLNELQARG